MSDYIDRLLEHADDRHEEAIDASCERAKGNSLMEAAAEIRHRELLTAINSLCHIAAQAAQP